MKKQILLVVLLTSVMLVPVGCKKNTTPTNPVILAPGAYNSTDQQLYQSLQAVQAALNNLKATLQDSKTSAQTVAILKPYFNQAVLDYDIAEVAWQTYHASLSTSSNASPAAAQAALSKVQSDLAATPKVQP